MRRLVVLALKEVRVAFRDVGALVTMLATPLALTLAIAAAFGTGGEQPLSNIPLLLHNADGDGMGAFVTEVFQSERVGDLVNAETVESVPEARARVDEGGVAALVVVPEDFSERMIPFTQLFEDEDLGLEALDWESFDLQQLDLTEEQQEALGQRYEELRRQAEPAVVEIYAGPDWRVSTAVIKAIVSQVLEQMNMMVQGTELIMGRTFEARAASNDLDLGAIQELFEGENGFLQGFADPTTADEGLIHIDAATLGKSFSWLDYTAASMAVLFLMFAVTSGGRTLLYERERGTLSRLLIMPAPAASILAGKMAGIALAGVLQVLILWGATSLLGAYWGDPLLVLISIVVLVACATSVGALISAWARTPAQAGAVGTAVTLVGAALSGSFLPRMSLPLWLQRVSLATPNAWGIEIFTTLQRGGGLAAALPLYGGALLLAAVYFGGALLGFRRQFD